MTPVDWIAAGAAAVSLYVLASMWLTSRHAGPPATEE